MNQDLLNLVEQYRKFLLGSETIRGLMDRWAALRTLPQPTAVRIDDDKRHLDQVWGELYPDPSSDPELPKESENRIESWSADLVELWQQLASREVFDALSARQALAMPQWMTEAKAELYQLAEPLGFFGEDTPSIPRSISVLTMCARSAHGRQEFNRRLERIQHRFSTLMFAAQVPDPKFGIDEAAKPAAKADHAHSIAINLSEPKREAFAAYRAHRIMGEKQSDVAGKLKTNQGQVSRWVEQVAAWISAGNVLPDLDIPSMAAKPINVDPVLIEMGERRDGLTKRQRGKVDRADE